MTPFKNTFKTHPKVHFQTKAMIQQETKSPQITTEEKGANTFPFHNLPPKLKKYSQRSLLCFFTFPFWIKEKSVVTLAIRNNCNQMQNNRVSSPTVLQNWRLCWGSYLKVGLPQGQITFTCLLLFELFASYYGSLFGFVLILYLHLGHLFR